MNDTIYKASVKAGSVEKVRLSKTLRQQIAECIEAEKTCTSKLSEHEFESLINAMNWLENQLDKSVVLFRQLDLTIAGEINGFIVKYRQSYPKAMQWVFNKINKRYSLFQITAGKE